MTRIVFLLPFALGIARAEAPAAAPAEATPLAVPVAPAPLPAPPPPPVAAAPAPVAVAPAPAASAAIQYECTSFPVRSTMAMGAFQAPADVSNARLNPTRLPVGWVPMAGSVGEGGAFVLACKPL